MGAACREAALSAPAIVELATLASRVAAAVPALGLFPCGRVVLIGLARLQVRVKRFQQGDAVS